MIECHGKLKVRVSQITQCAKSINCRCFKAKKKCSKHLTIKCYNTAVFDLLWWRTQLDSTVRGKKIVESRGGLSVCTKMSGNEKHSLWYFKCSPYVPWLGWRRIFLQCLLFSCSVGQALSWWNMRTRLPWCLLTASQCRRPDLSVIGKVWKRNCELVFKFTFGENTLRFLLHPGQYLQNECESQRVPRLIKGWIEVPASKCIFLDRSIWT